MLYLLRHTQPNVTQEICYGGSDVELHCNFHAEHLPMALSKLDSIEPATIYSSPLTRCRLLAEEVGRKMNNNNIVISDLLVEMNFGDWELMTWNDIYEEPSSERWFENYLSERCPNGESFLDMERRAERFLKMIDDTQGDVLAVTHAGFIRAMMVVVGTYPRERVFDVAVGYGDLIEIKIR